MPRHVIAGAAIAAALVVLLFAPDRSMAQVPLPTPPRGFPPPPPPPIKPYQQVATAPALPFADPGQQALRKGLAEAVQRKDRAALARLIATHGFFWIQDRDLADPAKPGVDSLAKAVGLDAPDGSGWDVLAVYAADPTAAEMPQRKGIFCSPSPPRFDPPALIDLFSKTQIDPSEWAYPFADGTEVRAAPQPNAPVIDKLGMYFVHVLPDDTAQPPFVHIALPSAKTGYILVTAIGGLAVDQICYTKESGAWKIAGYIGGNAP
jgi:hypothetical protein